MMIQFRGVCVISYKGVLYGIRVHPKGRQHGFEEVHGSRCTEDKVQGPETDKWCARRERESAGENTLYVNRPYAKCVKPEVKRSLVSDLPRNGY